MNGIEKRQQRQAGFDARLKQKNSDELSYIICEKFIALMEDCQAKWVMWYLNFGTEVKTLPSLTRILSDCKQNIIVPYCTEDESGHPQLGLWWLEEWSEMVPGKWGIMEPPKSRWGELHKTIAPDLLDLVMVPGVAFDTTGARLGYGAGYYDRLLSRVRPDTVLSGVCFESQLLTKVIMQDHDVFLDNILTEKALYLGKGRN